MVGNFLASNQGDIVLAPATTKKSKKPLIIGAATLLVIAIAVCAIVIIPRLHSDAPAATDTSKSYNSFLNYLLYGKNSDKAPAPDEIRGLLEQYTVNNPEIIYAESVVAGKQDSVHKDEYFKNLRTKYDDFASHYDLATEDSDIFKYFLDVLPAEIFDESSVAALFVADGYEAAKQEVNNRYSGANDSVAKNYYEKQAAAGVNYLDLMLEASNKKCLDEELIKEDCLRHNRINPEAYYRSLDELEDYKTELQKASLRELLSLSVIFNGEFADRSESTGGAASAK